MALFKKKSMTADELFKLIGEMSEEEQDKLAEMLTSDLDDGELEGDNPETTTEQIDEAEENAEEKGKKPTKAEIDESVGEQEYLDGDEDSQDADARVDEAEGEDEALKTEDAEEEIKEDNKQEVINALVARIDALEEKLAKIVESIDGDSSFGNYSPDVTEGDGDESTEDSRIMRSYMRKQAYRK